MKTKKLMLGIVLVSAFLMILPMNAGAIIELQSPEWVPNEGLVFSIDLTSGGSADDSFYLYNWGDDVTAPGYDINNALFLFNGSSYGAVIPISFSYDGNYTAIAGSDTCFLGDTKNFGAFFYDGSTVTVIDSYFLTQLGDSSYNLSDSTTGMTVDLLNANPVPIPATMWLFGAGLFGLVGIRRKLKS